MPILQWLNKEQAVVTARNCQYRLLEQVPDLSYGEPNTENMLIQGDNLEALKALIPTHAGRVKCIFIDPPYNTKSAFEHYDDNLEHSKWLSMIYPRLELLHQLLSDDGSIWITLDDNEAHYFKVIMDEIFGRKNFIQGITWHRKVSPANDATWFSNDHDFIFVYAKNREVFTVNRLEREAKHNKGYTNPDNDSRGAWNSVTFTGNKTKQERPNLYYPLINPTTGEEIYPPKGLTWRASKERAQKLMSDNILYWGKDGKSKSPRMKGFLSEAKPVVPRSVWLHDEVGHTQEAMTEQKKLSDSPFGTPKPERLLKRILSISTDAGDLVLDSFLGSATTAAVAKKMNRKFIGIELGEHAITHCQPRLQKVVDGESGGISKDVNWQGGGGFKFYRLGEVIFNENGSLKNGISFNALAAHIWYGDTKKSLEQKEKSPLLGVHNGIAYYLLYNGILGDKRPDGGNVLTSKVLAMLPEHPSNAEGGKKVIYGETSRMGTARLKSENIIFKQIPYDVRGR
ncbi:site-specific DNA-methyltransferase [Pseudoalteromonas distincta]|uniref:site-specific DNA-methyltransferase n=1 Tax=Pseudoalteromonas distincta TaxID=77608 RepID=UPI00186A2B1C|nr:site-specific DNA-methyltransferase [Pseudoalteromonas distincta]MBE3672441.1 site-specific DNA-methyltransferase (adenine-specific) [Pseudoalteromonas distincta KMM 3548]